MQMDHVTTGGPIGGALSYPLPPTPKESGVAGKSDAQIAKVTSTHLMNAIKAVHDPQLKAAFSQALASLHKYIAQDSKDAKAGSAKKVNPSKLVSEPKPVKSTSARNPKAEKV